jgi:hypothetical protein
MGAVLILAPGYFWVAWHAWRASKTVARDLAAMPIDHEDAVDSTAGGKKTAITLETMSHESIR